jgi:myo-inositol-1(or 4)-monophosphatase
MNLSVSEQKLLNDFTAFLVPMLQDEAEVIAKSYQDQDFQVEKKPGKDLRDQLDVVTRLDREVEVRLYEKLHKQFPELGFDVEEHKEYKLNKDFTCYIDPVDGTKYFARQIPLFSTQVALSFKGEPILGMVINPLTKETYFGSELQPSQRNGNTIAVSSESELNNAYINAGIVPFRPNWDLEKDWIYKKLLTLEEKVYRVRKIGSSALLLSWVAQGGFDAAVFLVADPLYDTMAGQALIKYAGGRAENISIPALLEPRLICSNKHLFPKLEELLLS